jgi:hypothetical protein
MQRIWQKYAGCGASRSIIRPLDNFDISVHHTYYTVRYSVECYVGYGPNGCFWGPYCLLFLEFLEQVNAGVCCAIILLGKVINYLMRS